MKNNGILALIKYEDDLKDTDTLLGFVDEYLLFDKNIPTLEDWSNAASYVSRKNVVVGILVSYNALMSRDSNIDYKEHFEEIKDIILNAEINFCVFSVGGGEIQWVEANFEPLKVIRKKKLQ